MHTPAEHSAGDGTPLYLAGRKAPAGIYLLVGTDREVRLEQDEALPATFDGQVAVYIRQPATWSEIDHSA